MPVFTVHMPFASADNESAAEKSIFVRDGFHFWAFVLGPIWLLWHRLWLAAIVYLAIMLGVEFALSGLRLGVGARLLVMLVVALLIGFEAATLWRWSRSRGRWREIGVVVADDREGAERRFFDRWTGDNFGPVPAYRESSSVPTTGLRTRAEDVIGLFPRPGVSR